MKLSKVIICILCLVLLGVGWIAFLQNSLSQDVNYEAYVKQGDAYYKEGLFHRAIDQYEAALTQETGVKVWDKNIAAHYARYLEAPDFATNYIQCLQRAVNAHPTNLTYLQTLVDLYETYGQYEDAYNWIVYGEQNGVTSEKLKAQKLEFRYLFQLRGRTYETYQPLSGGRYTLQTETGWGYMYEDQSESSDFIREYVGQFNGGGVHVETFEKDSRLLKIDGYVLGIFNEKVLKAGIFADGLIPAQAASGKWYYYDEFARETLGGYDYAGTFQSGKAAVQKDGQWFLIDTKGEHVSKKVFSEILLDGQGRYLSEAGLMVAAEDGKYALYDAELKKVSKNTWEDADCCYNTKLIAVKKDGKWGYVNENGEMVIKPQYDDARSFSHTLAAVCKDGKWGFINAQTELAINYQFLDVDTFNQSGCCLVKTLVDTRTGEEEPHKEVWCLLELEIGLT